MHPHLLDTIARFRLFAKLKLTKCARAGNRAGLFRADMKASDAAPLTRNQTAVYPELETHGGVVVGKGKAPYLGGTPISPTRVSIIGKP